jgi:phospholipase/carboxylesterase|tara:strand:+ start:235 stop:915 length:681 start_codon:yes stop_codon:yes gene_type:complete
MNNIPTNLLPSIVIKTGDQPTHSIIWLHGLGSDGNDFVPIVEKLNLQSDLHTRFVFPHAPMQPVSINNGAVMRAWYDISGQNLSSNEDASGIRISQSAVEKLIKREGQNGIKPENIVLAGFSQGGAIALHTGLRYSDKLAGILVLSSYLPLADMLVTGAHQSNASTQIFMAHGHKDTVISPDLAISSKQKLLELGYGVNWNMYQMEHSVCKDEIADISEWLKKILV